MRKQKLFSGEKMLRRAKRAAKKIFGKFSGQNDLDEAPKPKGLQLGTVFDIRRTNAFATFSWAALEAEVIARRVMWKKAPELYRMLELKPEPILKFEISRLAGIRRHLGTTPNLKEVRQDALQNMKLWGFDTHGLK